MKPSRFGDYDASSSCLLIGCCSNRRSYAAQACAFLKTAKSPEKSAGPCARQQEPMEAFLLRETAKPLTIKFPSTRSGACARPAMLYSRAVVARARAFYTRISIEWNVSSNSGVHANAWVCFRCHQYKPLRTCSATASFVSPTRGFGCAGLSFIASSAVIIRMMSMAAIKSRFRRFGPVSTHCMHRQ